MSMADVSALMHLKRGNSGALPADLGPPPAQQRPKRARRRAARALSGAARSPALQDFWGLQGLKNPDLKLNITTVLVRSRGGKGAVPQGITRCCANPSCLRSPVCFGSPN